MLIQQKTGRLETFDQGKRVVDILKLQWYETNKRILHKTTVSGIKLTLKFLEKDPSFSQDEIIFAGEDLLIVIDIVAADCIVTRPSSMHQMAALCYEIGNKHLPLFIEGDEVLVPFEQPLLKWLSASGFQPSRQSRKLLHPLKTTTMAHAHGSNGTSLFSKIIQLTKSSGDE